VADHAAVIASVCESARFATMSPRGTFVGHSCIHSFSIAVALLTCGFVSLSVADVQTLHHFGADINNDRFPDSEMTLIGDTFYCMTTSGA
jgi:hypothetical protein